LQRLRQWFKEDLISIARKAEVCNSTICALISAHYGVGSSWRNDTNEILAGEIGLGKTVQSVSMLGFLQ
ncbi:hypothetical protein Pfo_001968, partial [Paulownia fortunei]